MLARFLPSQSEMAAIDQATIASGVSGSELMERAGQAAAEIILKEISSRAISGRVLVLCGPGNNGGDGKIIARVLKQAGVQVQTLEYNSDPDSKLLEQAAVLVDALLGTGQSGAPRGGVKKILEFINHESPKGKAFRVSIDFPTGINGDTGEVYEPHFAADLSICIELVKRGLVQFPAREKLGRLCVVSIGLKLDHKTEYEVSSAAGLAQIFERKQNSHKGNFGNVLVIGGSENMPGAPALTALAAAKSGAGTVTKAHLQGLPFTCDVPEVMLCNLAVHQGQFSSDLIPDLLPALDRARSVVLGPGLGTGSSVSDFVSALLKETVSRDLPVVVDADALILGKNFGRAILTPHPGEAARLLSTNISSVEQDRYAAAHRLQEQYRSVILLKGAATVIRGETQGFVNLRGTPLLATAGSGDVLAGIIASLVAQGSELLQAARLGALIHSVAGELAAEFTSGPILASDIISQIPKAIGQLKSLGEAPCANI